MLRRLPPGSLAAELLRRELACVEVMEPAPRRLVGAELLSEIPRRRFGRPENSVNG